MRCLSGRCAVINFFFKLINLFLAVLGLCFCARAFSSCGEQGPVFIAVCGPLTIAASLVAEHRLQMRRLSSCGSRAQLLCGMWDLPRPGLEPGSPALAGRFSTTAPPGKPNFFFFFNVFVWRSRQWSEPAKRLCLFCNLFWLHWVFVAALQLSLVAASGSYSLFPCAGFSLRWLLLLWSTGSRLMGFSSCSTRAW